MAYNGDMNVDHDLELDVDKIEELGRRRESENLRFRSYLKGQESDKIDRIVHRLNQEISERIDCTTCGNCCRELKPCITDKDIDRLSKGLELAKDNIESDRPEDCRSFPHLHKESFISRLWGVIDNYSICPIVFNVFERLKIELNFR